jgi:RNA polymerase sigma factor (sigma-70 family)
MIDVIRRDSRIVSIETYDETSLYAEEKNNDLNEVLHRALETLPPVQRSVILLRDYEGYQYKEIGEITGLSEAQVKTYIFRGRAALRNYLVKTSVWQ